MEHKTVKPFTVDTDDLNAAFTDFILSRKAIHCSPRTIEWYNYILISFLSWCKTQAINTPDQINARDIREFLSSKIDQNLKDTTVHGFARGVRAFLKFLYQEEYIPREVKFQMPRIRKKRLPVLSAQEINALLKVTDPRESAVIAFFVDTGIRLAESVSIKWEDINITTGKVIIKNGKGGKARIVIISAQTRKYLLSYRRHTPGLSESDCIWRTLDNRPLTRDGMDSVLNRLSERTGIPFSAHALRRSFCILALRAGMSPLAVQDLMGHADLTMTKHYAQMIDDDLLAAHHDHSPIENLKDLI